VNIGTALGYSPAMISKRTLHAEAVHAGTRLDAFIIDCIPTSSRSLVVQAIEERCLTVNGRWEKKGHKLSAGDAVTIERLLEKSDWKVVPNPEIKIPVIHEEATFLVIDKPAGMPVHPLDPAETNTVVNGLLAQYPELAGVGPDPLFPAIVHRLDAETSGVMLVARDKKTYDVFRRQFRDKRVNKKYVALACGVLRDGASLENWLAHSSSVAHRMLVVEASEQKAMIAITEYAVRETFPRHTLLDVIIRTGVTHQIRCQLAHIGHPLAGDSLYGSMEADAGYEGRLFLHAAEIVFPDPATGAERVFQAELPGELQNLIGRIRG
jgi:23S rRNA pseudouridine1911/1915/1917 synthase